MSATLVFYFVVRDPRTGLEFWELDVGQLPPRDTVDRVAVTPTAGDC